MLHYTGMLKFIQPNVLKNVFEVIQQKKRRPASHLTNKQLYKITHVSQKKKKFHQKKWINNLKFLYFQV